MADYFIGNHSPAWASFSFLTVIHLNIFKILTFPYTDAPPLRLELHPPKSILSTSLVRMHFLQLTYQTPQLSATVMVEGWFFPPQRGWRGTSSLPIPISPERHVPCIISLGKDPNSKSELNAYFTPSLSQNSLIKWKLCKSSSIHVAKDFDLGKYFWLNLPISVFLEGYSQICTHLWLHGCPLTCWLLPTMPFSNPPTDTHDALGAVASSIAETLPSIMGSLNTVSLILSSHFRQRSRGLVSTDPDLITIRQTSFLFFWKAPSALQAILRTSFSQLFT